MKNVLKSPCHIEANFKRIYYFFPLISLNWHMRVFFFLFSLFPFELLQVTTYIFMCKK